MTRPTQELTQMHHFRSSHLAPIALVALSSACTFNTSWLDRRVEAGDDPGSFDVLSIEGGGPSLDETRLRIVGGARTDATASAHVVGLLGVDDDADAILSGFDVDWTRVDATTVGLTVVAPSASGRAWIDEVRVELPAARDVVLATDDGAIEVSDVTGRVEARTSSGSIVVSRAGIVELSTTSGSVHVDADGGNVHTRSGSMHLDLARWVDASAESGSVVGRIGGGGSIATSSGSIDVELTGPLDRDLILAADSGSIVLHVPSGASMQLDIAADGGSVSVRTGDARHDGDRFVGAIGEGGPTLHVRTGSGSIVVEEGPS